MGVFVKLFRKSRRFTRKFGVFCNLGHAVAVTRDEEQQYIISELFEGTKHAIENVMQEMEAKSTRENRLDFF